MSEAEGRLARLRRWSVRAAVAPEADPVRTLSSAVVAISTAVLSYSTLRDLGVAIGLAVFASYLFPLAFDAAVLAATRVWLNPALSRETRRYGAGVSIFTIAASIIGNAIWHLRTGVKSGDSPWWIGTVIAFSALIPFVLGMVVHMGAKVGNDVRKRKDDESRNAARKDAKTGRQTASVVSTTADTVELAATGTDHAAASVTSIGGPDSPRERIRKVRADLLGRGGTIAHTARNLPLGDGNDYSFADVDRLAGTKGYAKKVVPALETEEVPIGDGQAQD